MTASLPLPRLHVYVRRLVEAGHKAGSAALSSSAALQPDVLVNSGLDTGLVPDLSLPSQPACTLMSYTDTESLALISV